MTRLIDQQRSVIELRERLGHELRKARKTCGLSQAELAERTRIDQTAISQYERAVTRPTLDSIVAIEDALNLPRGALLAAAGYVECVVSVEDAIRADPAINDKDREILLWAIARARTRPAEDTPPTFSPPAASA